MIKKIVICFCILILLNSCSISGKTPDDGVWYCDELKMSIDFSKFHKVNNECVYFHNEDENYELRKCLIDYGTGIYIGSIDEEEQYLGGNFKYKNDTFIITTFDGKEYVFAMKIDGSSLSYDYDNNGNIIEEYEQSVNGTKTLRYSCVYNEHNRLVRVNDKLSNTTCVYEYDDVGNVISRSEYVYTTDETITDEPENVIVYE